MLPNSHPLYELLKGWGQDRPHPQGGVEFAPADQFPIILESTISDKFLIREIRICYISTHLLTKFLIGDYDQDVHRILYCATGTRTGFALCEAAKFAKRLEAGAIQRSGLTTEDPAYRQLRNKGTLCKAVRPDDDDLSLNVIAGFTESLKLDGILEAVDAWHSLLWPPDQLDMTKEVKWWVDTLKGSGNDAETPLGNALQNLSENENEFKDNVRQAQKAKNQRTWTKKAGRTQKDQLSLTKEFVKLLWVPAALWCRDSYNIARFLGWDGKGEAEESDRRIKKVNRAISELGLSKTRKRHHSRIEKAEKEHSHN